MEELPEHFCVGIPDLWYITWHTIGEMRKTEGLSMVRASNIDNASIAFYNLSASTHLD
jgi:hypothetical protein